LCHINYFPDTNRITVQASASNSPQTEFLIDTVSVTEIPTNPNWREEADARIEKIRKGTITVRYWFIIYYF
jgi:hypothetical protein